MADPHGSTDQEPGRPTDREGATHVGYITLEELKRYLTATGVQGVDDQLLTDFIEDATLRVEEITGKTFQVDADTTRRFSHIDWKCSGSAGAGGPRIWFDQFLAQMTSLTIEGQAVDPDTYYTLPVNETPAHALQFRWDDYPTVPLSTLRDNSIEIVGRWGYAVTPPRTVKLATTRLAAFYFREKDNREFNVIGDQTTGQRVMAKSEPRYVGDLLARYHEDRIWHGAGRP